MSESTRSGRNLLRWLAMLLAAAAIGSLAVPGFFSLTLKLGAGAIVMLVLWLIYPTGVRDD